MYHATVSIMLFPVPSEPRLIPLTSLATGSQFVAPRKDEMFKQYHTQELADRVFVPVRIWSRLCIAHWLFLDQDFKSLARESLKGQPGV